jgi:predicted acyl esterase
VADRFATGRRIRLLITGGSFPRSERNLGIDEDPATGTAMEPSHGSTACLWTSLDRCVNECHEDGGLPPDHACGESRQARWEARSSCCTSGWI